MKRILLTLAVCAMMAAPVLAGPSLGWWNEGDPSTTHAWFDFSANLVGAGLSAGTWITEPDDVISPNPNAVLANVTASQYIAWDPTDPYSDGYFQDSTKITINFELPNWENLQNYKELYFEVESSSAPTNISVSAFDGGPLDFEYHIIYQEVGQAYGFYLTGIKIIPNPETEKLQFDIFGPAAGGAALLYNTHIDTICIPAPGAILLGSIGVGFVGWLRRRRTL
jgi:hypothetical protein